MKRILALLLAVAMVFTLAACGSTGSSSSAPASSSSSAEAEPTYAETKTADVIVIGAGGGGLSAANEATVNGAESVIIVEMTSKTGGSLNYTSGSMACAESVIQKEDGVEDSQESFVQDILKNGSDFGGKPNEAMVREFVAEDINAFQWLWDNGLSEYTFNTDSEGRRAVFAPEHALYSIPRTYKTKPMDSANYSSAAHEVMDKVVKSNDKIEIVYNTKAIELLANDQGQVLSVVGQNDNGDLIRFDANKGIIVATGGYSANSKLMGMYAENGADYLRGGPASADGNGLRLMQMVGAALNEESMSYIPTFPMGLQSADDPTTGTIASTYTWKAGGIVVNQNGERFVNECESNPSIREVALEEQPGAVQYDIFTDKILEDLRAAGGSFMYDFTFEGENARGAHVLQQADSLEELAEKIGVPAENLVKTVEAYNASVEEGGTDEFGRTYDDSRDTYKLAVNKIEGDHFYAVPLHALCVMTLGGITTNEQMQVLDESGNVIPGLYAAGEVVGGIWGKFVSGGTGVMGPITFGRIAAQNVMSQELGSGYEAKPASNLLDESLFVKESSGESLFDMSSANLTDGEYTATVDGQEGPMTVVVTITDGKIAGVEITENAETEAVAGAALESLPGAIVAANSVDVDGVSGATLTSNRIKKAVTQCLEEANNA